MISRLCVFGVGLIGGSLARALRAKAVVEHVVGCSRNKNNLQRAQDLGVIDSWTCDPSEAVKNADIVVLATPLGAVKAILSAIKDTLAVDCILTDAGSAKRCVIEDVRAVFGELPPNFVAGHPIAGTEDSGVEASFASLYEDHKVILTPTEETSSKALKCIFEMWEHTGATVVTMDPDHHDEVLAATSHLPHLLAYSLVETLGKMEEHREIFKYAAGGFRDFTRIASSDPVMWHDICLANREAMLITLRAFQEDLSAITTAVETRDSEYLRDVFSRAKRLRDNHASSN